MALDWRMRVGLSFGAAADEIKIYNPDGTDHGAGGVKLVQQTLHQFFAALGQAPQPVAVQVRNSFPTGVGLGASAALRIGLLTGANEAFGSPLTEEALLSLAAEAEGHGDNVAAALYGGLVLVMGEPKHLLVRRLRPPPLNGLVLIGQTDLPTDDSRAVLPELVPHQDAVCNQQAVAMWLYAACAGDWELLQHMPEDRLHEPYRLAIVPGLARAKQVGREAGAVMVVLSGAGSSILALMEPGRTARVRAALAEALPGFDIRRVKLDRGGAQVLVDGEE